MHRRGADSTIQLNANAVFQLMLFAEQVAVRDAAATALGPAIEANPLLLECNSGHLDELPHWMRTAALIVASLIARDPERARDFGVQYPTRQTMRTAFRYSFEVERAWWANRFDRAGIEHLSSARATFMLPVDPRESFRHMASGSACKLTRCHRTGIGLFLEARRAWLQLPEPRCTRATTWSKAHLITPDGRLHSTLHIDGAAVVQSRRMPIDPAMLLRIESGALRGFLLYFVHRARYPRRDRTREAVLTIELGGSLDEPPVYAIRRGDLAPRYDLRRLGLEQPVEMPLLGGATLRDLEAVASSTGVWHGEHLRGSFNYHPWRDALTPMGSLGQESA